MHRSKKSKIVPPCSTFTCLVAWFDTEKKGIDEIIKLTIYFIRLKFDKLCRSCFFFSHHSFISSSGNAFKYLRKNRKEKKDTRTEVSEWILKSIIESRYLFVEPKGGFCIVADFFSRFVSFYLSRLFPVGRWIWNLPLFCCISQAFQIWRYVRC